MTKATRLAKAHQVLANAVRDEYIAETLLNKAKLNKDQGAISSAEQAVRAAENLVKQAQSEIDAIEREPDDTIRKYIDKAVEDAFHKKK